MKTISEIRKEGIHALTKTLGPVDMARFIQSYDTGTGEAIEYKTGKSGGCEPELYARLPKWLQTEILEYIRKLSGLTPLESLGLK